MGRRGGKNSLDRAAEVRWRPELQYSIPPGNNEETTALRCKSIAKYYIFRNREGPEPAAIPPMTKILRVNP